MEMNSGALAQLAEYFKVLSETNRLEILCCLRSGSKNVTEIITETGLGQANVSKHLKLLAQVGIVARRPVGVSVYYEIADPLIFDLCELVCNQLSVSLENRSQQLKSMGISK
jgi:DNA-binding transcriptional ArsR family regulator